MREPVREIPAHGDTAIAQLRFGVRLGYRTEVAIRFDAPTNSSPCSYPIDPSGRNGSMSKQPHSALERCHEDIIGLLDLVELWMREWGHTNAQERLAMAWRIRDQRKAVCDSWSDDFRDTYRNHGQFIETCVPLVAPGDDVYQLIYLGGSSAHEVWAKACPGFDPPTHQVLKLNPDGTPVLEATPPEAVSLVSAAFLSTCRKPSNAPNNQPSLLELRTQLQREHSAATKTGKARRQGSDNGPKPSSSAIDATAKNFLVLGLTAAAEANENYLPTRTEIAAAVSKALNHKVVVEALFGKKDGPGGARVYRYPQLVELWHQVKQRSDASRPGQASRNRRNKRRIT